MPAITEDIKESRQPEYSIRYDINKTTILRKSQHCRCDSSV